MFEIDEWQPTTAPPPLGVAALHDPLLPPARKACARLSRSPWPRRPCSASTSSPASWPGMVRFPRAWLAAWPPTKPAPGDACSPTPPPGTCSTTDTPLLRLDLSLAWMARLMATEPAHRRFGTVRGDRWHLPGPRVGPVENDGTPRSSRPSWTSPTRPTRTSPSSGRSPSVPVFMPLASVPYPCEQAAHGDDVTARANDEQAVAATGPAGKGSPSFGA